MCDALHTLLVWRRLDPGYPCHGEGGHTHRKEPSVDVAAWPHGLERQRFERVSKQRDLTMLNLEDLGMSEVEPRRRPLAATTAPASEAMVASPMETVPAS